jgi:hypothetical protein
MFYFNRRVFSKRALPQFLTPGKINIVEVEKLLKRSAGDGAADIYLKKIRIKESVCFVLLHPIEIELRITVLW